jgi:hypothetical protein
MNKPASDGVRSSPRWSGRAIKMEGVAFVMVGIVSAIVVELLAVSHSIALTTRDYELRGSVSFALVGLVTFFIGWTKSRRTGS